MSDIENPTAYARAITARIKFNRYKTGVRKLVATLTEMGKLEVLAWLRDDLTAAESADLDARFPGQENSWGEYCRADVHGYYEAFHAIMDARRKTLGPVPTFLREAQQKWGGLTEKQLAVLLRLYDERTTRSAEIAAQRAAERANATPWVAGRQVVEGVVVSARQQESDFGMVTKALVKRADGSTLWLNLSGATKGATVTMRVEVVVSDKDPTFAFGKRPTKVVLVPAVSE